MIHGARLSAERPEAREHVPYELSKWAASLGSANSTSYKVSFSAWAARTASVAGAVAQLNDRARFYDTPAGC